MRATFYLLFISVSLICAQMPWEIPSLPEDSDEDINRGEFECFARCFNVHPSSPNKENNNTLTKVCERKVVDMRILRIGNTRMYISKFAKTWYQAFHFCRRFNMNLPPFLSLPAETALSRVIIKHAQPTEGFWVGATDMGATEGKFYWTVNGLEFEKAPVKIAGGTGRCLELKVIEKNDNEETEWAKADCNLPKRFICSFASSCIIPNVTTTT